MHAKTKILYGTLLIVITISICGSYWAHVMSDHNKGVNVHIPRENSNFALKDIKKLIDDSVNERLRDAPSFDRSNVSGRESKNHKSSVNNTKVYVIPTYPTSGSEYIRTMYSKLTNISVGTQYKGGDDLFLYKDYGFVKFYLFKEYDVPTDAGTMIKTHYPVTGTGWDEFNLNDFSGVVLLVRSPGDGLLRNRLRWPCNRAQDKEACYVRIMSNSCRTLEIALYNKFHNYWMDIIRKTNAPVHIIRYEDAVETPKDTFGNLIEFLNDGTGFKLNEDLFNKGVEAQLASFKSKYEIGTYIRNCSRKTISNLIDNTKVVYSRYGYYWDEDNEIFKRKNNVNDIFKSYL